jgi:hypothetical protein
VHSISRTWTQGTNNEPGWLSKVRRVGDDDKVDKVEGEDLGRVESGVPGAENGDAKTTTGSAKTLGPEDGSDSSPLYNSGDPKHAYIETDDIRAEGEKEKGDGDEPEIWHQGDKVRRHRKLDWPNPALHALLPTVRISDRRSL